jgi:selenocysteine-specific elongation factor
LRLLEGDEAAPGEEAWAQLRLQRPLAPLSGDRFIIRDANETLGGGVIVETAARRHPRRRPSVLAALERVAAGDPAETLLAEIARSEPAELQALLAQTALPGDRAQAAIETLRSDGRVVLISDGESRFVVTVAGLARVVAAARSVVEAHLKQNPLRAGIAREELRSRLNLRPRPFAAVLDVLTDRGELVERGTSIATAGWEPRLSPAQRQAADAFLAELRADPYSPANDARPEAAVVGYLEESGAVVEAGGIVFANEAFQEMTTKVIDALATKGTMTMGEVRDLLGTSRRYVQPFLEELDNRGITMRRGDVRLLRQNPQATEPSSRA